MKVVCQYMAIFFNFLTTSYHLHRLQVENCESNSRIVVDEDDNGKFRPDRVNIYYTEATKNTPCSRRSQHQVGFDKAVTRTCTESTRLLQDTSDGHTVQRGCNTGDPLPNTDVTKILQNVIFFSAENVAHLSRPFLSVSEVNLLSLDGSGCLR